MTRQSTLKHLAIATGLAVMTVGPALAQDGPVNLRFAVWTGNEAHLDLFNSIAADFIAQHPNVGEITFETLPFDGYTTSLTTQIAGGNAPDLAWIFESTAPDFVASGALAPLTDALRATEGYDYDDLLESPLALWQRDGELYAYPFSTSAFGVFVNNDLIDEAGQPRPSDLIAAEDWTWNNAITIASAVHDQTGAAGLVVRDFEYRLWDNLATIWNGWGAAPWGQDGRCSFDSSEMIAAMDFIHDAIFDLEAMPGPGTSADFFAGDAAMTITQISRASLLTEDGFDWDLVPLPSGPAGPYAVLGQAGIGVFDSGDNVDEAIAFLAFMTNPENSAGLAQFFPPPRRSLLNAETLGQTNPLLSADQIDAVVIEGIATGTVKPSHTNNAQIAQTVRAELDGLWQPDADVASVMADVCARIQPLLDR